MTAETRVTRRVYLDTETTSLRPDRRVWEAGVIVRDADGTEETHHWFVDIADLDLGNADLYSLRVGRFHDRHPQARSALGDLAQGTAVLREAEVMAELERLTRGAHLVGAVVSFDADVLSQRMRAHGLCPSWHYHLIDIEALAVGCLAGRGWPQEHFADPEGTPAGLFDPRALPWVSDELSAALGVPPASDEERHTAVGDAKWAMRVHDAVMGASGGGVRTREPGVGPRDVLRSEVAAALAAGDAASLRAALARVTEAASSWAGMLP